MFLIQVLVTSHTVSVNFFDDSYSPIGPPGSTREMIPLESPAGDIFPPPPPPSATPSISAGKF